MGRKLSQKEVVSKIKEVHGNLYDLSSLIYVNKRTKFKMSCKKHGVFLSSLDQTTRGQGCPVCGKSIAAKKRRVNYESFFIKASDIHNNKYEYDVASFSKISANVKIKCFTHGWFEQRADAHIRQAQGCPDCGSISQGEKRKMSLKEFEERANEIHGFKFNYSKVKYINFKEKIEVICPVHNSFFPTPSNHLNGSGCPNCNNSKGENKVKLYLKKKNIRFIQQKMFKGLKDKGLLKCDFYLPNHNVVIEYNGRQHYEVVKVFGGEKGFQEVQKRDQIKRTFLELEGIKLLEIHYLDKEVEKTISDFLN